MCVSNFDKKVCKNLAKILNGNGVFFAHFWFKMVQYVRGIAAVLIYAFLP